MIALALLIATQPLLPVDSDIVVIAQKIRLIRFEIDARKHDGKLELNRCRILRTSGDAEIDAIPCASARQCMLDNPPTEEALGSCVKSSFSPRVKALVAARRAAKAAHP